MRLQKEPSRKTQPCRLPLATNILGPSSDSYASCMAKVQRRWKAGKDEDEDEDEAWLRKYFTNPQPSADIRCSQEHNTQSDQM